MCGKVSELKTLNETLHKENIAQDRELRKLRKEIHQLEQMINNLKSEISLSKYCTPNVPKKDAEVMAGMCCTGAECGDWEPVKDFNSVLREEMVSYQERMQKFDLKDVDLKPSGNDVRALRKANLALREQLHSVCTVCAALSEQCRAAVLRGQLKDDIIREMRRQLKHAKAKSKEAAELISMKSRSASRSRSHSRDVYDSVTIACVRQQPRRRSRDTATLGSRDSGPQESHDADAVERPLPSVPPRSLSPDDGRSPRLVVSGDDLLSFSAE